MRESGSIAMERTSPTVCLSVAGLDPSGGAGVLADVRTMAAFGCYPAAVVTSVTFQNTQGVFGAESQSAASVSGQMDPIFDDLEVAAVKTGMLPEADVIEAVARVLRERGIENIVVDPVVRSTSGFDLIDDTALRALVERLFPIARVVTPNLPEAERITGKSISDEAGIREAAFVIADMGARNVLIKGGHSTTAVKDGLRVARDFLLLDGTETTLEGPWYDTTATHGTGCALSSAIAACLALGYGLDESVNLAKKFVSEAIRTAPLVGRGSSPINLSEK